MSSRILVLLCCLLFARMSAGAGALGTSAASDSAGRLWIAYAESAAPSTHVKIARSDDGGRSWQPALRVTAQPEPVAADGENRPKLAFGPRGQIFVAWTSPTSKHYTADIRFARSLDGGSTWSQPATVHRDRQRIGHRFESLFVDGSGRIWIAWLDKRDAIRAKDAGKDYVGDAVYYAYSDDDGASWQGDFKLGDHSCECCQIALAGNGSEGVSAFWRHVFDGNERDHAVAVLQPSGKPAAVERATFDRWRIEACPHHGPRLAIARDGTRHAVWFNQVNGEARVSYGQLSSRGPMHVQRLPMGATHADIAVIGDVVAIAWKRFDGHAVAVESWLSRDGGRTFASGPVLHAQGDSDQPRLVSTKDDLLLVWRRADDLIVERLSAKGAPTVTPAKSSGSVAQPASLKPFSRGTLANIEQRHAGRAFWLVLWDLECAYCMQSLRNLAKAQRADASLAVVTIATDPIASAESLRERLQQIGITSEAYAFDVDSPEALRFAIDPTWMGEKPRAYRYAATGKRQAFSGVLSEQAYRTLVP